MRSLALLGLVVALLAATALASPWVAWGVAALTGRPFTFTRVYDRVFEVLLVVGLVAAWRRLDLGGAADIGFRRAGWGRQLATGFFVGAAGLVVGLGVAALLGGIVPALRYPAAKTLRKAFLGLGAATVIGVGEEALFRGVLLRRLGRDAGRVGGVIATTVLYAAVHAIGRGRLAGPVHAWSGVERTAALLAPLTDPSALPALAGLAGLGLLLAWARLRSGGLWLPIGIHAAWVAAFRVGRLFFAIQPGPPWLVGVGWPPLVGGATGWIAVGVGALLLARTRRGARA